MVNFKCPRCGEIFNRHDRYIRHTQGKNVCHPLLNEVIPSEYNCITVPNNIFCEYCNKSFMDEFSLKRHLEICKKKKLIDEENKKNKEDEQKQLIKKMDELMAMVATIQNAQQSMALVPATNITQAPIPAQMSSSIPIIVPVMPIDNSTNVNGDNNNVCNVQSNLKTKINNNNNSQNLNVTFSYNNPDLSHISDNDYKSCINAKLKSVPKLLTKVHFNPDKPENHNIYLEDMDSEYVNVFDGTQWKRKKKDYFVDDAVTINENMLQRWVEYKEDPVMQNALNRYYDLRDEEGMEEKIQQDVLQTMFNNRRFAEKKYKAWKKEQELKEQELKNQELMNQKNAQMAQIQNYNQPHTQPQSEQRTPKGPTSIVM
jgi:hypothetical protein